FAEIEKFRDHMLRLDADNRRMRFGMRVDDYFIKNYTSHPSVFEGVIYGFFIGNEMRAAAELRLIGAGWSGEAEAAFSVEREWQDIGIGTELLGRLIMTARNRGINRLYMNCLSSNRKMQCVAKKYEAELLFDHGDVVGKLQPSMPTPQSLFNEVIDDSAGFVMA
ncbi:MAG: GNAT family N-acetyltransferase, partial [Alphaproteobacteria bacterium]